MAGSLGFLFPERTSSLNIEFLGGIFLGHPGPRRRDIPDKDFMQEALFCCFRQGVAGMSRDLGQDVPDLEKLYARELWAAFPYPKLFFPRINFGITLHYLYSKNLSAEIILLCITLS